MKDMDSTEDFAKKWISYRPEIKLLDCTIRDGGLMNDHLFDDKIVKAVYSACIEAGIDYMEIGYKNSKKIFAPDKNGAWKYCDEDDMRRIVGDNDTSLKLSAMADAEKSDYKEDILPKKESVLDMIRVACYIHQVPLALDMIKDAHDKGYETTINLMSVSVVPDRELDEALELLAKSEVEKDRADFDSTVESIRKNLSKHAYPVALPIGAGENFKGVMDLIDSRAFLYDGGKPKEGSIPSEEEERFKKAQTNLIEEVAETNEALFDKLASGEELKKEEILPQLIKDIEEEEIIPVLVGSAHPPKGTTLLLDTLNHLILPPPGLPELEARKSKEGEPEKIKADPSAPAMTQIFKVVSDPGVGDIFFLKVIAGSVRSGQDMINARSRERERLGHLLYFQGKERKEFSEVTSGDVIAVAKLKGSSIGDTLCSSDRVLHLNPIVFPEPVMSLSVHPKTRKDQDKLGAALGKLSVVDPTLHYSIDPEFNETLLSGMGEVHLEIVARRLKDRYSVDLELGQPHVPYRESITKKVKAQGKYKKQTGGHGQYGDAWISMEPLSLGSGFEFANAIKGGVIPTKYILAVQKGIKDSMKKGGLAGYPVVDVKITLFDGSFHAVDSSDLAFQMAGSLAFRECEKQAQAVLLEPIMRVEITVSADYVGAITNDLNSRRGKIAGMDQQGDLHIVSAEVPMAEMFKYSTDLRSITRGAGSYHMELARYEAVPHHLLSKIVQEAQEARKGSSH